MNLLEELHAVSPFDGFVAEDHPVDEHGWNAHDPIFGELIDRHRPELIIEVGTWKGASAIAMAEHCRARDLPTRILCIDTWLGAGEFWDDKNDPDRYQSLRLLHGYPRVYYTFLANVARRGLADRIVPFPQTSLIAARWLAKRNVKAELIYIDGSHDAADVAADLQAYWPLVSPGGCLFGDDYNDDWPGVKNAVDAFPASGNALSVDANGKWRFARVGM